MEPFASDRSYEVLQARRLRGELGTNLPHAVPLSPELLRQEPIRIVNKSLRELDTAVPEIVPSWHFHRGRKGQR